MRYRISARSLPERRAWRTITTSRVCTQDGHPLVGSWGGCKRSWWRKPPDWKLPRRRCERGGGEKSKSFDEEDDPAQLAGLQAQLVAQTN